jgi:hypothetical protein
MKDWKLVLNGHVGAAEGEGPRPSSSEQRVELFDLAHDPGEKHNLAAAQPQLVETLRSRYDRYANQAVPPKAHAKPPGFQSPRVWGQPDR